MIEEIIRNIYRIPVVLPDNPLREVNCYFIRGNDSDLLIDTGFCRDECRQALAAGLAELGSEKSRLDVLLTHLHSDHSGLATEFAGENRNIYITGADLSILNAEAASIGERWQRLFNEGFPKEGLDERYTANAVEAKTPTDMKNFRPLEDGEELQIGDFSLKVVMMPGHTPGIAMFWMEREKIMFTGDHVLFDITPNIIVWHGVEDSLGDYLNNLNRAKSYPVELALPGHRKPGDYHARIDQLLLHHEKRIQETLEIVRANPGLTAYEIAGRMKWKIRAESWQTFPIIQKWFAVGECLAHLDYLKIRNKIYLDQSQVPWRYTAV